jgi:hypothetical protein
MADAVTSTFNTGHAAMPTPSPHAVLKAGTGSIQMTEKTEGKTKNRHTHAKKIRPLPVFNACAEKKSHYHPYSAVDAATAPASASRNHSQH